VLLAEDLLLLVTDDASGRLSVASAQVDAALGGANLIELSQLDKIGVSGAGDPGRPGRLVVRDPSPAGDDVLDAALAIVGARPGKKPSAVISQLGRGLRTTLYERLASAGVLRAGQAKALGLFPVRRWPANDSGHEEQLRQSVTQALVQQAEPDPRTAALIALLHALKCEHKIADPRRHGISERQLRARAGAIAEGNWAADAVRKAIQEMNAAVAAAAAVAASGG
jgi:Golgi phosphoprotein 3 GPP34